MSVRREKRRAPNGAVAWDWIVDFVFRHPDGRHERVRRYSPVNNRDGAQAYERELRKEMLAGEGGQKAEEASREMPTFDAFAAEFLAVYSKANNKPSEFRSKQTLL